MTEKIYVKRLDRPIAFSLKTMFTQCGQFEEKRSQKVRVAKFEVVFTQFWNNLKTIGNLTVKNSLQNLDVKEITFTMGCGKIRSSCKE